MLIKCSFRKSISLQIGHLMNWPFGYLACRKLLVSLLKKGIPEVDFSPNTGWKGCCGSSGWVHSKSWEEIMLLRSNLPTCLHTVSWVFKAKAVQHVVPIVGSMCSPQLSYKSNDEGGLMWISVVLVKCHGLHCLAVSENILCLFKSPDLESFVMLHHLCAPRHEHQLKSPQLRGKNHPVSTSAAINSEGRWGPDGGCGTNMAGRPTRSQRSRDIVSWAETPKRC